MNASVGVVQEYPRQSRLGPIRVLSTIEERICNDVAGRLLVPGDTLSEELARALSASDSSVEDESEPSPHTLWYLLDDVARRFQVSWWCALRRVISARAGLLGQAVGPDFCLLLVGSSTATGAGRGTPRLRLLDCWWPKSIDNVAIKPVYPGLALERLGRESSGAVTELLANSKAWGGGEVAFPMELQRDVSDGVRDLPAQFRGWWKIWTRTPRPQIAIYGRIVLQQKKATA